MICVSVTPSSRGRAAANLFNASRQGDLIELCLDKFKKSPDVGALLKVVDKPVLVSCRRERDGGHWDGSEDDRIQLLRNAIVSGPAYVELDLAIADQIPRFGSTKRVSSHNNLNGVLNQAAVDEVFEQCRKAKADVVKFTWLTETPDDTWPLLVAATQNCEIPVVGRGIGLGGLAFSLLGRRYGAPWIYTTLEHVMETFDGEATVTQLENEYCWSDINRQMQFVGIVGQGTAENAAFKEFELPVRCQPLIPEHQDPLRKMLEVLKARALVINNGYADTMGHLIDDLHDSIQNDGHMDLIT